MADPSSKRRIGWFSFSLRTLLLGVTVLAIWLGWWVSSARQQRLAVATIRQIYADAGRFEDLYVCYDYQLVETDGQNGYSYPFADAGVEIDYNAVFKEEGWLRDRLGIDFFHNVVGLVVPKINDPDSVLAPTGRLLGLQHLVLSWGSAFDLAPSDAGIAHLAGLKSLKSLDVDDCSALSDEALRAIGHLPRLEVLKLWYGHFSDAGLRHLAPLTRLRMLVINSLVDDDGDLITDGGVAQLSGLTELEHLYIDSKKLTGESLKSLAKMQKLGWLTLNSPSLTDDDLRYLASLESLHWIEFIGTGVNGTGFRHFRASKAKRPEPWRHTAQRRRAGRNCQVATTRMGEFHWDARYDRWPGATQGLSAPENTRRQPRRPR